MNVNFYARPRDLGDDGICPTCKHHQEDLTLHIGGFTMGYAFGLHVIPEMRLTDWPEWKEFLKSQHIWNGQNDGQELTLEELTEYVEHAQERYDAFNYRNAREPRPIIYRHGEGRTRGTGSWDLIEGDFS